MGKNEWQEHINRITPSSPKKAPPPKQQPKKNFSKMTGPEYMNHLNRHGKGMI